jgi:hypothetical protein
MSQETHLSVAEFERFVELQKKPRIHQDLTPAERAEYDTLARRSKIRVPQPPVLPPTIIIPKTHVEDYIVAVGGGGPVA